MVGIASGFRIFCVSMPNYGEISLGLEATPLEMIAAENRVLCSCPFGSRPLHLSNPLRTNSVILREGKKANTAGILIGAPCSNTPLSPHHERLLSYETMKITLLLTLAVTEFYFCYYYFIFCGRSYPRYCSIKQLTMTIDKIKSRKTVQYQKSPPPPRPLILFPLLFFVDFVSRLGQFHSIPAVSCSL